VAGLCFVLLLTGCGTASTSATAPEPTSGGTVPAAPGRAVPVRRATKLLVVVEENHSLTQMRAGMPYTFSLAKRYGYATRYHALAHPSLPNYLAIAGGSTYGVRDDADPSQHPLQGASVFGRALAHGRTAGVFADAMPGSCVLGNHGQYVVRHNPWAYFADERDQCDAHDLPMASFADAVAQGDLPRAGLVVPDLGHDAHDGSLAAADAWFHSLMTTVFAGPDWSSGHLAVVLTADEDDRAHGNRVLTVLIHPSQRHHVVREPLSHYSLNRLYAEVLHVPAMRAAAHAPSMAAAFGLPLG
jgi:acid phosphatase